MVQQEMQRDSVVVSNATTSLAVSHHVAIVVVARARVSVRILMVVEVVMRVVTQAQNLAREQIGAGVVDHVVVVGQNASSVQAESILDVVASVTFKFSAGQSTSSKHLTKQKTRPPT